MKRLKKLGKMKLLETKRNRKSIVMESIKVMKRGKKVLVEERKRFDVVKEKGMDSKTFKSMLQWRLLSNGNYTFRGWIIVVTKRGRKRPLGTLYKQHEGKIMLPALFSGTLRECLLWTDGKKPGHCVCGASPDRIVVNQEGDVIVQRCGCCRRFLDSIKDERISRNPEVIKAILAEAFEALRKAQRNTLDSMFVDEKYDAIVGHINELEETVQELFDMGHKNDIRIKELEEEVNRLAEQAKDVKNVQA